MNDSETLRAALGTLRQQEAKGRGKYDTDFGEAHRPPLTADDRVALREYRDMGWTVGGRWISLGQILDAWTDAAMRAHYSAAGRADALAARVAELESELSATERTSDAERERAKRAERLLESESARVAELEESVSLAEGRVLQEQEGRRLDARAAEARENVLKREIRTRDKKIAELEAQLQAQSERHVGATVEYERQAMELEAENERLRGEAQP